MTMTERRGANPVRPIVFLAVAVGLAVAACYVYEPDPMRDRRSRTPEEETRQVLAEARRVLQGASQASSMFFTVDPHQLELLEKVNGGPTLRDWRIRSEKSLDSKTTAEVLSILTSEGTYSDMGAKCFDPGLGFRFDQGFYSVDVVICLHCRWVYAYAKGGTFSWALSKKGEEDLLKVYKSQTASDSK